MDGWVGGWLENEFLKKTPSPKFGLESQLGTFDLEFVNKHVSPTTVLTPVSTQGANSLFQCQKQDSSAGKLL